MTAEKRQLERKAENLVGAISGWRKQIDDAHAEIRAIERQILRLELIELLGDPTESMKRLSGSKPRRWFDGDETEAPSLLTPEEAADALSISPRKLWGLTFEDPTGPPHVKIGRLVRYPAAGLDEWIKDHTK